MSAVIFLMTRGWRAASRDLKWTLVLGPAVFLRPEGCLGAVSHADSLEDVGQMRLHGLLADFEPPRDQLVRKSVGEEREDLALARRELRLRVLLRARRHERL